MLLSHGQDLKVRVPDAGFRSFLPLRDAQGFKSFQNFPVVNHCTGDEVHGKIESRPLLPALCQFFPPSPDSQQLLRQIVFCPVCSLRIWWFVGGG